MAKLYWKMDLDVICPYCGLNDLYVFYINAESLICNHCEKEFNIEIWAKSIEVKTSK